MKQARECPQNGIFHNACDAILMSWMAVSELVYDDDDDAWPLVDHLCQ